MTLIYPVAKKKDKKNYLPKILILLQNRIRNSNLKFKHTK